MKLLAALALMFLVSPSVSLPAQDWAKTALLKSPRHYEFVPIKHGDRTVVAFVVYPEVSRRAPVIVMIHEIFGLSDWAKLMADELAAKGYIVIAPDLLSGTGPNGGGTESFAPADVNAAVSRLSPDQVTADLDAAADYGKKLPAASGKLFVAGFCWGGGKSFAFATHRHDLGGAFVFYGPPPSDFSGITAPVYGFYAGNDARITATVPATTDAMKAAGKKYDPVIYEGAGHGFMRAGQAPDANDANKKAYNEGFARLTSLVDKLNSETTSRLQKPAHLRPVSAKPAAAAAMSSCHDATPSSDAKHGARTNMTAIM